MLAALHLRAWHSATQSWFLAVSCRVLFYLVSVSNFGVSWPNTFKFFRMVPTRTSRSFIGILPNSMPMPKLSHVVFLAPFLKSIWRLLSHHSLTAKKHCKRPSNFDTSHFCAMLARFSRYILAKRMLTTKGQ